MKFSHLQAPDVSLVQQQKRDRSHRSDDVGSKTRVAPFRLANGDEVVDEVGS